MNGEAESRERSRTPSPLSRSSSRSSIGQSPARTTLLKRNQSLSAKQVRFYRNGDKYFGGLKLAVSSERYKEFFALLVELSNKLDLKTGAVRFVFDAETGRQITDVSQLSTNSSYVCSSSNSFKEIEGGYGQTQPKNWSTGGKKDRRELTNWDKSSPRMDSKREFIKPKLVTVVKNGKPPQKKVTMLLNKKTALDLNQVLDHLSSKGTLGKVDRLCCLDGREIKELRDLFDEDMIFIAFSSNERFPDEGFDVDVQSPKQSWNTSIRPSRSPYTPSLRTEHEYSWKDLPRARCLACALKALTAVNTPSPQSRQRPRPKSAPPRLSNQGQKARKPESRPSSSSSKRSLQPNRSKSPRISPSYKDAPSSGPKSSSKKPSVRASYPKMSSPKSSTSVKKSLSFSPETKGEETDSAPKPKGIRGGGRRRKAQLALMKGEVFQADDPQHAYYVLIHEDVKSGKPTASVKPIMSGENEAVGGEKVTETGETSVSSGVDDKSSADTSVVVSGEAKVVKKVVHAISEAQGPVENDMVNGLNDEHSRKSEVFEERKVVKLITSVNGTVESPVTEEEQSPATNNNTKSPANVNEEKSMERDWSKPKPIRGRKKKPKADLNGNEQNKPEEKHGITSEQASVVNGAEEFQQQTLVVANGDS
ncbi:serine/threonine-protein kinase DCLK2-like isoform X2 [Dendronephthya gigantea]|uniref:serine/threonine-protein kinase DCLK2-like isoform X2 n=1 Tax=Dendronephthya gigantea TaxID=151771 RepID=UPI0010697D03|nr:serine/threonine-protein kinase DCLK2-like isoform X2 [Dendronephthya gigantea]